MDIISSCHFKFWQRRSEFYKRIIDYFKLIDEGIVDQEILYGSLAVLEISQFMPSNWKICNWLQ